jgi:hypothetical protein
MHSPGEELSTPLVNMERVERVGGKFHPYLEGRLVWTVEGQQLL